MKNWIKIWWEEMHGPITAMRVECLNIILLILFKDWSLSKFKNRPRKNLSDFWQYFRLTWPKWLSLQHWSKQCCLVMACQGMPWAQHTCTLLSLHYTAHCTPWEHARQRAVGTLIVYKVFLFISVSCAKPAKFSIAYLFQRK